MLLIYCFSFDRRGGRVADVQGFVDQSTGQFFVKEFFSCDLKGEKSVHILFNSPEDLVVNEMTKHYLEHFHHGLKYDLGFVDYVHMETIVKNVFNNCDHVFMKGLQKKQFLQSIIPSAEIYDLLDFNCPNLNILPKRISVCKFHSFPEAQCAQQIALSLKSWILDNIHYVFFKHN